MKQQTKNAGLKKIHFYDTWMIISFISLALFFVVDAFWDGEYNLLILLWILFGISTFVSFSVINLGMLYNAWKNKKWIWLIVFAIFFFLAGGFYIMPLFYFFKMRKEFKKRR